MTARSGQWSRCSDDRDSALADQRLRRCRTARSRPYARTVFTDVCRMTGDRSSTAAASTASMLRSLRMLKAATPYRSRERAVEDLLHRDDGHADLPGGATAEGEHPGAVTPVKPAVTDRHGEKPPSPGGRECAAAVAGPGPPPTVGWWSAGRVRAGRGRSGGRRGSPRRPSSTATCDCRRCCGSCSSTATGCWSHRQQHLAGRAGRRAVRQDRRDRRVLPAGAQLLADEGATGQVVTAPPAGGAGPLPGPGRGHLPAGHPANTGAVVAVPIWWRGDVIGANVVFAGRHRRLPCRRGGRAGGVHPDRRRGHRQGARERPVAGAPHPRPRPAGRARRRRADGGDRGRPVPTGLPGRRRGGGRSGSPGGGRGGRARSEAWLHVAVVHRPEGLRLLVQDEALDLPAGADPLGTGAHSWHELVARAGGGMAVERVPGWGTLVRADFPYRPPPAGEPPDQLSPLAPASRRCSACSPRPQRPGGGARPGHLPEDRGEARRRGAPQDGHQQPDRGGGPRAGPWLAALRPARRPGLTAAPGAGGIAVTGRCCWRCRARRQGPTWRNGSCASATGRLRVVCAGRPGRRCGRWRRSGPAAGGWPCCSRTSGPAGTQFLDRAHGVQPAAKRVLLFEWGDRNAGAEVIRAWTRVGPTTGSPGRRGSATSTSTRGSARSSRLGAAAPARRRGGAGRRRAVVAPLARDPRPAQPQQRAVRLPRAGLRARPGRAGAGAAPPPAGCRCW